MDLKDFAARAVKGAHASPTGGFGDEKTFISHAKAHLDKTDPHIAKMSDAEFKVKLLEAHKAGHLELGRADLVEAMNPHDVANSKLPHPGSSRDIFGDHTLNYHFIRHPEKGRKKS